MSISTVGIIGEGESAEKIQELISKSDFKIVTSGLSADYARQVADVDLVIEVAPEDINLKKKILKSCAARCRKDAILATVTANPWVTRLAGAAKNPEKVVGLNFTKNPFEDKYLAQIVRALQTFDNTVQTVKEFLEKTGVTAINLEETPGFILDRVIASIVNEAAVMYSSKLATKEDIDKMMRVCVNWPMGPFEFADNMGLDRVVELLDLMAHELGPKYQPCFLLRKMVDAGWLGKKTGHGFYVYS